METVTDMLRISQASQNAFESISDERFEAMLNREAGTLGGYDCTECRNRGYFWRIRGAERWTEECKCMTIRRNMERMEKSGLGRMLDEYTFETYRADQPWQQKALAAVKRYLSADDAWLYVAGQPGSGKTHLCTALVRELLGRGEDVRYMRWVEDGQRIRFCDFGDRDCEIKPLQECAVLYIDDFLKTQNGAKIDPREIPMEFEILNMRYGNHLKTIISTEYYLDEVTRMDEAMGSRIAQRSKGFNVPIKREDGRNWRLR